MTRCVARMGLRPRVSDSHSPLTRPPVLPSSIYTPWEGSERYAISGLHTIQRGTASPYLSSSLPFCVRFNAGLRNWPYTCAATLDTGPLARSYPGGVSSRLSPNHFQFAHRNCVEPNGRGTFRPRNCPWLTGQLLEDGIRQQTVIALAIQATRRHMYHEPSDKLYARQA